MDELDLIREWFDFNATVRTKYLSYLASLHPAMLEKDVGASFPSIVRIYCHVLDAYNWWFVSVIGLGDGDHNPEVWHSGITMDKVKEETSRTEKAVSAVLERTSPDGLQRPVTWSMTTNGVKANHSLKLRDIMWHMVEEELQHRGELNALLWQMDLDPPQTAWDEK